MKPVRPKSVSIKTIISLHALSNMFVVVAVEVFNYYVWTTYS